jgi:hypothetical protein
MLHETFKHRSGRVISLGRLALACVFLLGVWLDPTQPSRAPGVGYLILALYVIFSGVQLGLTWNSWWLESRLAAPAHVIDIGVFSVMVFLSEGYTSPFFTFFVFLLLSSTIRWGWRETALTALGVITLFFLAGLAALEYGEAEFDVQRLIFRSAYLVVLSLILIWFGVNQKAKARQMPRMELEGAAAPLSFRSSTLLNMRCSGPEASMRFSHGGSRRSLGRTSAPLWTERCAPGASHRGSMTSWSILPLQTRRSSSTARADGWFPTDPAEPRSLGMRCTRALLGKWALLRGSSSRFRRKSSGVW